jgi:hypothetical protein
LLCYKFSFMGIYIDRVSFDYVPNCPLWEDLLLIGELVGASVCISTNKFNVDLFILMRSSKIFDWRLCTGNVKWKLRVMQKIPSHIGNGSTQN